MDTATYATLDFDDVTFDLIEAALAEHASDLDPSSIADLLRWTLVPDDAGRPYKAEFTALETVERTVKVNRWFLPDRRGGETPRPHNHPWAFRSQILRGGYAEDRYTLDGGQRSVQHAEGEVNEVGRALFHEVVHVEPGTVTLMLCSRGERGTWGYLDPATGLFSPPEPDPLFTERLRALNPHQVW